MVFICVILGDAYRDDLVNEPLVSGVLVDYGAGNEAGKNWEYWYAGFHKYMKNKTNDGTVFDEVDEDLLGREDLSGLFVQSFAYPLTTMHNAETLNDKVIEKLKALTNERQHPDH